MMKESQYVAMLYSCEDGTTGLQPVAIAKHTMMAGGVDIWDNSATSSINLF